MSLNAALSSRENTTSKYGDLLPFAGKVSVIPYFVSF